jgi:hypothetical protein
VRPRGTGSRASALAVWALLLAVSSCSDLPAKPVPLVQVHGVVTNRDGTPVGWTWVVFIPSWLKPGDREPSPPEMAQVRADFDGSYSAPLYAGEYNVTVAPSAPIGLGQVMVPGVRVSPERPRFDYRYTGLLLEGEVTGRDGAPLLGADVRAYRLQDYQFREAISANGHYSMLVSTGSWVIDVNPPSTWPGLPSITLPAVMVTRDTTVDIALNGEPVTITVTGPGASAVPGAIVSLTGTNARCAGTCASDGTVLLYAPPGDYSGAVSPPSAESFLATRTFVTSITGPTALALDLSGVEWTGTALYSGSGLPAAGARLYARSVVSPLSTALVTLGAGGEFRLVVPAGTIYDLELGYLDLGWVGAGSDSSLAFVVDSTAVWQYPGGLVLDAPRLSPPARPR